MTVPRIPRRNFPGNISAAIRQPNASAVGVLVPFVEYCGKRCSGSTSPRNTFFGNARSSLMAAERSAAASRLASSNTSPTPPASGIPALGDQRSPRMHRGSAIDAADMGIVHAANRPALLAAWPESQACNHHNRNDGQKTAKSVERAEPLADTMTQQSSRSNWWIRASVWLMQLNQPTSAAAW